MAEPSTEAQPPRDVRMVHEASLRRLAAACQQLQALDLSYTCVHPWLLSDLLAALPNLRLLTAHGAGLSTRDREAARRLRPGAALRG